MLYYDTSHDRAYDKRRRLLCCDNLHENPRYQVPFMSELQGFLEISWNPFYFSLFTASMNLSDQLVIVVCEPDMEG